MTQKLPPSKHVALIIWFAILSGVFIIAEFAAGGFPAPAEDFEIVSYTAMLLGIVPLIVGVILRLAVLSRISSDETFLRVLVVGLALCEGPAILALFAMDAELATERAFAVIGSIAGIALLIPFGIKRPSKSDPDTLSP